MKAPGRQYRTLDGLRGVAALSVVMRHSGPVIFGRAIFGSAHLAVDLFFLLSGFVIANAYEARLAGGMGAREFFAIRLTRLYPLFALGVAITVIGLLPSIVTGNAESRAALLNGWPNLFMLPAPATDHGALYPLNVPAWSLFCELVVNLAYVLLRHRLSNRLLLTVVVASGIALFAWVLTYGSADAGVRWDTAVGGLLRAFFGFFLGVLLFRNRTERSRVSAAPYALALALVPVFMAPKDWAPITDLVCVFVAFPLLVSAAVTFEPGRRGARVFLFMGATSYAVYVLHFPLLVRLGRLRFVQAGEAPTLTCVAFMVGVLAIAWGADRWFDGKARAWLTSIWRGSRPSPSSGTPSPIRVRTRQDRLRP